MAIKRPAIPHPDMTIEPSTRKVLLALKENQEIANGQRAGTAANQDAWKRRSVTLAMLIKLGVITEEQARSVWQEP